MQCNKIQWFTNIIYDGIKTSYVSKLEGYGKTNTNIYR